MWKNPTQQLFYMPTLSQTEGCPRSFSCDLTTVGYSYASVDLTQQSQHENRALNPSFYHRMAFTLEVMPYAVVVVAPTELGLSYLHNSKLSLQQQSWGDKTPYESEVLRKLGFFFRIHTTQTTITFPMLQEVTSDIKHLPPPKVVGWPSIMNQDSINNQIIRSMFPHQCNKIG